MKNNKKIITLFLCILIIIAFVFPVYSMGNSSNKKPSESNNIVNFYVVTKCNNSLISRQKEIIRQYFEKEKVRSRLFPCAADEMNEIRKNVSLLRFSFLNCTNCDCVFACCAASICHPSSSDHC